ncbi:MAG: AI-2E family transporter [Lachnospiraceae bacterium]|nr:AI-2E family transporter [Lachnospiraceae bacterium]
MKKRIKEAPWYAYAVAACIAVVLLVILMRSAEVWKQVRTFVGYFRPVILGCVIAYIINPLAEFLSRTLFRRVKKEGRRDLLSNMIAFIVVLLLLVFFVMILIPQLIDSIGFFAGNLGGYISSLINWLENWSVTSRFDFSELISSSEHLLDRFYEYVTENISSILEASANAGKGILQWVIAVILSVYLLFAKKRLKAGVKKLSLLVFGERKTLGAADFIGKCSQIFNQYIVFNLIDSLIIGTVTAIFMAPFRMAYIGLISFLVALANLVPTFGPVVGAVLSAFILLMINPAHAFIFLIFFIVLQTIDAYIIKPKLFGNSLGISGLLILVGVTVGGNMFGVVGILIAVPVVAILDLVYSSYFLPWLERRRERKRAAEGAEGGSGPVTAAGEETETLTETGSETESLTETGSETDALAESGSETEALAETGSETVGETAPETETSSTE